MLDLALFISLYFKRLFNINIVVLPLKNQGVLLYNSSIELMLWILR
jgi:hypothetical protein